MCCWRHRLRPGSSSSVILVLVLVFRLDVGGAGLAVEEAGLLDGASGLGGGGDAGVVMLGDAVGALGPAGAVDGAGEVRNLLGDGVLGADGAAIDTVTLAGLRHGVVARVEVLAVLQVFGEVVGPGGQFAVETEEALFLWGEGLEKKKLNC